MDNRDKKSKKTSIYDKETDWLDDEDDYLDDGGLLGSLLFGDKKKKKKSEHTGERQVDRETTENKTNKANRARRERPAGRPADEAARTEQRVRRERPAGRPADEAARAEQRVRRERPAGRPADEAARAEQRVRRERPAGRPADEAARAEQRTRRERPAGRPVDETVRAEQRARRGRPADEASRTVRKPAGSVGVTGGYDEYYHEDAMVGRAAYGNSRRRGAHDGGAYGRAQSTSVDRLLDEINALAADESAKRAEAQREAWERTQRNVAKAKAEAERLEIERQQNEREEARKRRTAQEIEKREAAAAGAESTERAERAERAAAGNTTDNVEYTVSDNTDENTEYVTAGDTAENAETVATGDTVDNDAAEAAAGNVAESGEIDSASDDSAEIEGVASDDSEAEKSDAADTTADNPARDDDMLDMDELERIEKDIDENKLKYSESDTEDLELGEIGKALGFDAVELEDDEEEPEQGESDSEKFFRENLLDEADPKVVNPEKKRMPVSNKVWGIAFVVLLVLFILIGVIYIKNYARMKYNEMDINEISADQLTVNDGVKDETDGYRTIALYGVDSRDSNLNSGTNSDSIIIVSIEESTKTVKLVSVYRDTLMQIASGSEDTTQKVNYAYQLGGAVVAMNTLNTNLDLNITDYVTVDFSAMASIIDAVGGVEVSVTDEEVNNFNKNLAEQISLSGKYSSGITEAGTYTLDGQQAVAYSRIRSTGQGDVTRTERQRVVLLKVIDKLLAADSGSLSTFVDVSFECISTSLNKDDIKNLVGDVADYTVADTVGFPFAYSAVSLDGKGSCLAAADMAANVEALHEYLYGNSHYTVSADAQTISDKLAKETGVTAQEITVKVDEISDGTGDDSNTEGDLRTITTPPDGMVVDE